MMTAGQPVRRTLLSSDELEAVRKQFRTPLLYRGELYHLGKLMGIGRRRMIKLIDAGVLLPAPTKQKLTDGGWCQWHRDTVLEKLNFDLSTADET